MDTAPLPAITVLEGPSVHLREWRSADLAAVREASLDDEITLISSLRAKATDAEALAFIERQVNRPTTDDAYALAIADNSDDSAMGHLFVDLSNVVLGRVTIGYWVLGSHRGKGAASQALELATSWIFDTTAANRITLYIEPRNEGSQRTAAKVGFVEEAMVQAWATYDDDVPRDMQVWVSLRPALRK